MTADWEATTKLVGAAQAGDAAAREGLFQRYLPRVSRMVAARLGVPRDRLSADGEDLAQEALIKALGSLGRFELRSPGGFARWMETIVLNCVRQRSRKQQTGPERVLWQRYGDIDLRESLFSSGGPTPSMLVKSREQNEQVEQALLDLPQTYRCALVDRFIGEMSYGELAERTGRQEASCRKIVQRALTMLRERLVAPTDRQGD